MSTKEIMKYGFRYSNSHFKEKRILAIRKAEITQIEKQMNWKNHLILEGITLEEIETQLDFFFQFFPDIEVEQILYSWETESLCLFQLNELPTSEKFAEYMNLKKEPNYLSVGYHFMVRMKDLLNHISKFSELEIVLTDALEAFAKEVDGLEYRFPEGTLSFPCEKEEQVISVFHDKTYQMVDYDACIEHSLSQNGASALECATTLFDIKKMIYKEEPIEITKDIFLELKGKDSSISFYERNIAVRDLLKFGGWLPKQARIMEQLKDKKINLSELPVELKKYLLDECKEEVQKEKYFVKIKTK